MDETDGPERPRTSIMDLAGRLAYEGEPKTIEQMNEAIAEAAAGDFDWRPDKAGRNWD